MYTDSFTKLCAVFVGSGVRCSSDRAGEDAPGSDAIAKEPSGSVSRSSHVSLWIWCSDQPEGAQNGQNDESGAQICWRLDDRSRPCPSALCIGLEIETRSVTLASFGEIRGSVS